MLRNVGRMWGKTKHTDSGEKNPQSQRKSFALVQWS
jgi:hypothetical protein